MISTAGKLLGLTGLIGCLVVAGAQQPPGPTGAQPPAGAPRDPAQDRASLQARLERSLTENKVRQQKIEDALARIKRGDSLDSIRDTLDVGPGWGRPGDEGGRGRGRNGAQAPSVGPRPEGARRDGQAPPRLEPAEREAVLAFVTEHNPPMAERLRASLKDNPDMGERSLARLAPHIREVMAERDPEMRQLRIEEMRSGWETMAAMRKLGDALRKDAAGSEAKEAEAQARELLGAHFDMQVKLRNREIAVLEERIAQIRQELGDKLSERQQYIDQRLKMARERASQPRRERSDRPEKPEGADATKR